MLRRKTRRALVLRRKDWIVIAILGLALIGSIFIWVLFLTAWSPKTTSTPHSRTPLSADGTSGSGLSPRTRAVARLRKASSERSGGRGTCRDDR